MTLEDLLDTDELRAFERAGGAFWRQHHPLAVGEGHVAWWADKVLCGRRGEVVPVVLRGQGELLLHTKTSYPPGLYRLPSGGVLWGERVIDALHREVFEETGFRTFQERFLGLLTYDFQAGGRSAPFASYVFLIAGATGQPTVQDESESISGFRWLAVSQIATIAAELRSVAEDEPGRRDWGCFRALVHDFVAQNETFIEEMAKPCTF
ncbi:MAG: NUDIX hydrolase [Chloroflexota bacterium]